MGNGKDKNVDSENEIDGDDVIRELDPSDLEKSKGGLVRDHRNKTNKCPPGQGGNIF